MKPNIRIIHHLGKTGGTFICRCLGCMQKIVLLSEVHPIDADILKNIPHPLRQAYSWFDLFTLAEVTAFDRAEFISFSESIDLIFQKCLEKNKTLVLRDWNHLDFIGEPFITPTFTFKTNQALREQFDFLEVATVRHPIDQWFSMQNTPLLRHVKITDYLAGYWKFLQACRNSMSFIRYEDFCKNPQKEMRYICQLLDLTYDATFIDRWMDYTTITGDTKFLEVNNRDRGRINSRIEAKFYPRNGEIVRSFENDRNYQKIVEFLNYPTFMVMEQERWQQESPVHSARNLLALNLAEKLGYLSLINGEFSFHR